VNFERYDEFERWVTSSHENFELEKGALEMGPFYSPTVIPGQPPWDFTWYVKFPDKKYIRAWEVYDPLPRRIGGAFRNPFSLHYGDLPPNEKNGFPVYKSADPVDIRIDYDRLHGSHLHYGGEDHIPQTRVKGMAINSVNAFEFVTKIQQHRCSGKALAEVFGFTVEPVK
jgi:hypothetical protein